LLDLPQKRRKTAELFEAVIFIEKAYIRGVIKTKPETVNIRQTIIVRENFVFKET
jgi:hypothetical protein